MDPGTHFVFGTHKDHGFVASTTALMPAHLAHWFLVREQFEPVPDSPGLYRLTASERDGPRRTRQAAQDLRRHGYAVHVDADVALASAAPPRPLRPNGLTERRSRIARAAASQSSQRRAVPTTSPPSARSIPPKPAYASAVHLTASAPGRSR
ncbi:hypothetical protein [Streptomyces hirsutus]|uniref:hypothetical protein n=1 Tax=Streptomyces hirsutus TaxID=35620 RepID=UPI0006E2A951|nr:hypothetical protein [Streptomyces hirsutus]